MDFSRCEWYRQTLWTLRELLHVGLDTTFSTKKSIKWELGCWLKKWRRKETQKTGSQKIDYPLQRSFFPMSTVTIHTLDLVFWVWPWDEHVILFLNWIRISIQFHHDQKCVLVILFEHAVFKWNWNPISHCVFHKLHNIDQTGSVQTERTVCLQSGRLLGCLHWLRHTWLGYFLLFGWSVLNLRLIECSLFRIVFVLDSSLAFNQVAQK